MSQTVDPKHFYVTSPIYYVNDIPHIGHAYTSLACDVMVRFARLMGADAKFLTGTDEHGQKVEKSAQVAGIDPKEFVDRNSSRFRELCEIMNFSNDDFIRTTEPRHIKAVQHLWNELLKRDEIYLDKYAGWYSVRDEAFFAESELVDGKAPTGAPVEWVEEPSYFFRLSKWQEPLLKFYEKNADFIYPESRRNEVLSFVRGGLTDLSVSRTSFKWGIPVPNDEKHVMYVWLDALTNYITALGYPDKVETSEYKQMWESSIHVVGKDILRFHAVYWPAFLMAAGLNPPAKVVAHGWWTNEGQKISKSIGNVINPLELVESFGLDQTRYFLMREVPFGNDGNYSRTSMINRINSELANNIGNLAQRTLSFIAKNCDGKIPTPSEFKEGDKTLLKEAEAAFLQIKKAIAENSMLHLPPEIITIQLGGSANAYIDTEAPWSLRKTDLERMNTVLYVLLEAIRHIGLYLLPYIPDSANKLLDLLAVSEDMRNYNFVGEKGRLKPQTPLPTPTAIFPRFEV